MNPRERVIRSIEFKTPDRYPVLRATYPASLIAHGKPLFEIFKKYLCDFNGSIPTVPERMLNQDPKNYRAEFVCPWGSTWEEKELGILGQVIHPALDDWDKLKGFRFPAPPFSDKESFEIEKERIEKHKETRYALGSYDYRYAEYLQGFSFFQRLFFLRGYENLMIDISEDRDELHILADRVIDYLTEAVRIAMDMGVDGILFADDWGTQSSLMINPSYWRSFFKPRYQKLFDFINRRNVHIFFHTDGHTMDIIPDLIDMGVDVINPQFSCMDLKQLAEITRGKVCMLTDLDRQYLLPKGSPEEIHTYVEKVIRLFGTEAGGLILRGSIFFDVPPVNVEAMFAAFETYGTLKQ